MVCRRNAPFWVYWLLLGSFLLLPGTPSAQVVECKASFTCVAPVNLDQAIQCMCQATRFLEEARSEIGDPGFTGFDDVLPSDYEITGKYSESLLDSVLEFALSAPRTLAKDELLYEASFRKASAHGMFGDDSLLRGLDPRSGGGGVSAEQVIGTSRKRLDSRACHDSTGIPVPTGNACATDGDCASGELCLAERFGAEGPFGAVQEYRRAEQALMDAIRVLGVERFRQLDDDKPRCLGIGCAARLLVRLGSQKARAQAEFGDLMWRRAIASAGILTDALECSAGKVNEVCTVHRECNDGNTMGRCGSGEPAEESAVLLREVVQEGLAEAAAAETLYAALVPPDAFEESSDFAQRINSLARLRQIETRSINGTTPFGIPADYIPLLSSVQESHLDCLQNCGTTCDKASNTQCLHALAEGPSFLNLLEQARAAQNDAIANAQEFANATKDRAVFENQMATDFVRVIERLLGASCQDLGETCTCSEDEAAAGLCITFQGETWITSGLICDDPDDPLLACEVDGIDGEFERQILAIRGAEVSLDNVRERLDRNEETYEQVIQKFAALAGIREEECTDTEVAIDEAGSRTSSAIDRRERRSGLSEAEKLTGIVGGGFSGAQLGAKAGPIGAAAGFLGGAGLAIDGMQADARRKKARADFEKATSRIQNEKELELTRIRCRANAAVLEVDEADALFQVETERQRLLQQFEEQQTVILDSLVAAQQLAGELRSAAERLTEAKEQRAIFDDLEFRNPANFRAVALAKQLQGADKFRTAQILTWMILRSVAYDLAQPDFALPQTFLAGDVLSIPNCRTSRCTEGAQAVCATSSECTASPTDSCQLAADETGVADSNGACSMQAVFAARTVDDLESLIGGALLQIVAASRTLACQGECQKRISLRNIFTDANLLPTEQPTLGDVLLERRPVAGTIAVIDFGISPKRGFRICPQLPDGSIVCQPDGVANLAAADVDGFGDLSANIWNARMINVKGLVRYDPVTAPTQRLCRNPADGEPVNTTFTACRSVGGVPLPEGSNCSHASPPPGETGCFLASGDPNDPAGTPTTCKCITLLATSNTRPVVSLRQLDPGVVRTPLAEKFRNASVVPRPAESLIRYQMRRGDLPLLGTVPDLEPFRVPSLTLFEDENLAVAQINIKGVPVASTRWQIRLSSQGLLANARYRNAFLRSIVDIELILAYQGFDPI